MKKSKSTKAAAKKIFIVDDHPMMRDGLSQLISQEPDLAVCGQAGTANEAYEQIPKTHPELVLVDITLPDKSGLEFIKDVQAAYPGLACLVISMHDESLYAERVLRAGGRGYIMKQEGGKKLMEAIRQVLGGKVYVSQKMSEKILDLMAGSRSGASPSEVSRLTDREFEIFQLIGRGHEPRDIAQKLHLSVKTVEVHRLNIKEKLQLKTVGELIRYAVRWVESQGTNGRVAD